MVDGNIENIKIEVDLPDNGKEINNGLRPNSSSIDASNLGLALFHFFLWSWIRSFA